MDLVWIVGPDRANEPLRYSLRSAAAHLPHDRVWIVGYCPSWVSDEAGYVEVAQDGHKHANTLANVRAIVDCDEISDEFVLMNDDFFVMADQPGRMPMYHRGPLDEFIARLAPKDGRRPSSWYARAIATRETLIMLGRDPGRLLSYELHVPMVIDRRAMGDALSTLDGIGRSHWRNFTKRTFYGNYASVGGVLHLDVKIRDAKHLERFGGMREVRRWPLLSTADAAWPYSDVGTWVRGRFPQACRYEKEAGA